MNGQAVRVAEKAWPPTHRTREVRRRTNAGTAGPPEGIGAEAGKPLANRVAVRGAGLFQSSTGRCTEPRDPRRTSRTGTSKPRVGGKGSVGSEELGGTPATTPGAVACGVAGLAPAPSAGVARANDGTDRRRVPYQAVVAVCATSGCRPSQAHP